MTFSEGWIFGALSDDNEILKVDRFTGEIVARVTLEHEPRGSSPEVGARYLANFPYVMDVETLEVVFDAHRVNSEVATLWRAVAIYLGENYCIFRERYRGVETGWFVVNLDTMEGEYLQTDISLPRWLLTRPDVLACQCGDDVQLRDFASQQVLASKPLEGISSILCDNSLVEVRTKNGDCYYLDPEDLSEILVINTADCRPPESPSWWKDDRLSPIAHRFGQIDPDIPADMFAVYHWRQQRLLWKSLHRTCKALGTAGDLMFLNINDQRLVAVDKWTGEHIWELPEEFSQSSVRFWGNHIYISGCPANGEVEFRCYRWQQPYISPARPSSPNDLWVIPELVPEGEAIMDSVLVATPDQMPEAPQYPGIAPAKEYPDLETLMEEEYVYQWYDKAESVSPDGCWKILGLIDNDHELETQYLVLQDQITGRCRRLADRRASSPEYRCDDFFDRGFFSAISWDERGVVLWTEGRLGLGHLEIDVASASFELTEWGIWPEDDVEEYWGIGREETATGRCWCLSRFQLGQRDQVLQRTYADEFWPEKGWVRIDESNPLESSMQQPFDKFGDPDFKKKLVVVKCPDGDSTTPVLITSAADEAFTQEVMAKLKAEELTLPMGLEGDDLGGKLRVAC
ncbi:MAG: hypothetical protein K6L60_05265 [Oceanobacter sp.]